MASGVYNLAKGRLGDGTIDWDGSATFRVLLVDSTYTFEPDNQFVSDVSAKEIAPSGYARQTLTGRTVTVDQTNDRAVYDATDTAFGALGTGATIGGAIVYQRVGADDSTPSDDILIAFLDCPDAPTNGGTITVQYAATGVFYLA